MKQNIQLSVIIVTWNSQEDIAACLTSLLRSTRGIPTEIFVVDNVSKDNTVTIVSKKFPGVTLLKQKKNWGFGQGNNIALRRAKGRYFLLLNPDTKVNPHAIRTMMRFLDEHPKAGAVGPEQVNGQGDTIFMFSRLSVAGAIEFVIEKALRLVTSRTLTLFAWPHKTSILNGGCILARRTLLPTRQWFDPDCFIYGEEQYLFRQVRQQNWEVYFLRNCSIIHYREKSIAQTGNKWKFARDTARTMLTKAIG